MRGGAKREKEKEERGREEEEREEGREGGRLSEFPDGTDSYPWEVAILRQTVARIGIQHHGQITELSNEGTEQEKMRRVLWWC